MGIGRLIGGMAVALGLALPAAAHDKLTYGTASRVGLVNAAMYLAESLGFFFEEDIELETVQFDGTGVLLPQIASKKINIGYPIPDFLVVSHDTGKDPLPIRFFYNVTRVYNWEVVVKAESPVRTLADLKGKTIGVIALSAGNVPVTRSALKEIGLEVGRDVDLIAVGQGASAVNAFKTGRIDALNQFDVVHSEIEVAGTPLRRIPLADKYTKLSGNSFAAHVDYFRDKPDLLQRFGRGYTKGLVACAAEPEMCVRQFWKFHPTAKPTSGDEAKSLADSVRILTANLDRKIPAGDAPRYGYFEPESWRTLLDVLVDNGTVKKRDIDLGALYTNDFVPAFGQFDKAAVIARAKQVAGAR